MSAAVLPKFRKDNAIAFLKRTNARPISLLDPILDAGVAGASTPDNTNLNLRSKTNAPGGGGLCVGKTLLLRARADDRLAQQCLDAYLYALVATHAVSSLSTRSDVGGATTTRWDICIQDIVQSLLDGSDASGDGHASSPHTLKAPTVAIRWITTPGSARFDTAAIVKQITQQVETGLINQFLPSIRGRSKDDLAEALRQHIGRTNMAVLAATLPSAEVVMSEICLRCLACIEVSQPHSIAEFVHAVSKTKVTANQTTLTSTMMTQRFSTAANPSATSNFTPLIVIGGLGSKDTVVACAEKQFGVEIPLRWALETLTQTQHAAIIITERFRGGSSGSGEKGLGFASSPSLPWDLRNDSYLVERLTSRWAMPLAPDVASQLSAAWARETSRRERIFVEQDQDKFRGNGAHDAKELHVTTEKRRMEDTAHRLSTMLIGEFRAATPLSPQAYFASSASSFSPSLQHVLTISSGGDGNAFVTLSTVQQADGQQGFVATPKMSTPLFCQQPSP